MGFSWIILSLSWLLPPSNLEMNVKSSWDIIWDLNTDRGSVTGRVREVRYSLEVCLPVDLVGPDLGRPLLEDACGCDIINPLVTLAQISYTRLH